MGRMLVSESDFNFTVLQFCVSVADTGKGEDVFIKPNHIEVYLFKKQKMLRRK